jgi:hypothetical protein
LNEQVFNDFEISLAPEMLFICFSDAFRTVFRSMQFHLKTDVRIVCHIGLISGLGGGGVVGSITGRDGRSPYKPRIYGGNTYEKGKGDIFNG